MKNIIEWLVLFHLHWRSTMTEREKTIQVLFKRLDTLEVRCFYADIEGQTILANNLRDRIDEILLMLEALMGL